jgi:hypothetical protein
LRPRRLHFKLSRARDFLNECLKHAFPWDGAALGLFGPPNRPQRLSLRLRRRWLIGRFIFLRDPAFPLSRLYDAPKRIQHPHNHKDQKLHPPAVLALKQQASENTL